MGANTRSDSRFTLGEGRNGNRNSTRARQIYDAILGQNYVVSAGWYTQAGTEARPTGSTSPEARLHFRVEHVVHGANTGRDRLRA